MSTVEWGIVGYGICTNDIDTTVGRIKEVIAYAPVFEQELKTYFMECEIINPTLDDYLEYDSDHYSGLAYLIARVMEEAENGIQLDYCVDGYNNYYVLFAANYPWLMNEKMKNLTKKQVHSMFAKYIHILTDKDIKIGYINTTNFG